MEKLKRNAGSVVKYIFLKICGDLMDYYTIEDIDKDPDLEKMPPAMKEKMLPAIKEKYDSAKNYLPEDNQIYVKYAGPIFFGDPDAMGVSELLCSKYERIKK